MSVEEARNFKEELLGRDIRQLGRMLGETIRAQEGDGVFDRIESIRRSCIGFRRDEDGSAHDELAAIHHLGQKLPQAWGLLRSTPC